MNTTLENSERGLFPVAAIAAGTGGMDAIIRLIAAIPEDSKIAYVITVQHSTGYPDNLAEAISSHTNLPVSEIINTVAFIANHIYVIPPNSSLISHDGILTLHHQTRFDNINESLDLFFLSIAEVYKSTAIGIILSGTGFQGIEGFKRLKEIGAATIAQNQQTATFREMPQSFINAGLADYVEKPEQIAHLLQKIVQGFDEVDTYNENGRYENERKEFISKILEIIHLRTGNDFSHYKGHLIRKRIAYRMVSVNRVSLHDYYAYVRHNGQEQDLLFNNLLITTTGFFSDPAFYDSLTSTVFAHLVQNTVDDNLRIWIAGCATGQQAYSVAICLHEYLKKTNNEHIRVQIFASDLSEPCILAARRGVYTQLDIQQISEHRLQHYFIKRNDTYHVGDVIRNMCIFMAHNVVKDRPLSKIDLICCTNLLPFFKVYNQNLALSAFHFALKEKGVLVLGTFDNIRNVAELFENFGGQKNLSSPIIARDKNRDEPTFLGNYTLQETTTGSSASTSTSTLQIPAIPNTEPISENDLQSSQQQLPGGIKVDQKNNWVESNDLLASKNDELLLLNDELRDRQKQLSDMANFAESLIQTIHEPVLLIDKNFIIQSANAAFYNYFKTAQKKTAGYSFFEIGNCQWNIAEFKAQIIKMQHDKTILENYRVETECEEIGKKIMNVSARLLHGSAPEGLFLIALQDITEIKYVYELFEAKNLELQKYNELLQTFAVAATNNILDPLQKIQMLAKRIIDKEMTLSDSSRHNLQRILFSAQNMNKLFEDLILYSKISFLKKEYKSTDLNLIIKRSLTDLKSIIKQTKAIVRVGALPQLEVIPNQIQQLLTNIISNAIQYSKDGVSPEIHIDAKQPSVDEIIEIEANPEISFAKITIRDNGIGFDKRYQTQIFDPFFRLHTNDQYIGSGLGLTLVKKIVKTHYGYVNASSKIDEGTKINIFIPVRQA